MRHLLIASTAAILGAVATTGFVPAVAAQQERRCLHGAAESPAEGSRRIAALRLMRSINTAHAQAFGSTRTYGPLSDLTGVSAVPDGFVVQHAADGRGYAFAAKDTSDPCGFTLFSDQLGLIYVGAPLR